MDDFTPKRLTLFMGHYGSGKTNLAFNFARMLKRQGKCVTIADLDIVNPYFRTKDSQKELEEDGISLIVSKYANSNVDLPSMSAQTYALIDSRSEYGVLDIGGDDRGALALGRYADDILAENDYDAFFVVNRARPLTQTVEQAVSIGMEIMSACRMGFTGVVNNSNIGDDTTAEYVRNSIGWAKSVADALSVRLVCTTVMRGLKLEGAVPVDLRRYEWQK